MHLQLQKNIQRLKNEIHHISDEDLALKISAEKWSKKEILGHLIDSSKYFSNRCENIFGKSETFELTRFDQDALVKLYNYQAQDTYVLMIFFQSLNGQIFELIKNFTEDQLKKTIKFGSQTLTVKNLIEGYLRHLDHHLKQILLSENGLVKDFKAHISLENAFEQLSKAPSEFVKVLEFGDLEIEFYQPNKIDKQQPHTRDEVYVVATGSGEFELEGKVVSIKPNDVLFVKAYEKHKFLNFTDDFSIWVIFYGLER